MKRTKGPERIVEDFVRERLHGNIDSLKQINLFSLMRDDTYGCVGSDRFDPDDTVLMRAIYCAVFRDAWPGLCMDCLNKYVYRGETLNTYNTMFGWKYFNPHYGLDFHNPTEQVVNKVMAFQSKWCPTIGNMMLLPNIPVPITRLVWNKEDGKMHRVEEKMTMNMYRGCHEEWHDFFDRLKKRL